MNELVIYSCIMILGTLISAFSQVMLKKSAQKQYENKIKEYFNPMVIIAYAMFFGCTLLSIYCLKVIPLSMSPILESASYIFVAMLGYIFFREKLSGKQFLGMLLIVIGIVVFSI